MSAREGQAALLVLAKYPTLGLVKTRLASSIGDDAALNVYKAMLADSVERAEKVARTLDVAQVWVHKPSEVDFAGLFTELRSEVGFEHSQMPVQFFGYDDEPLADQQAQELRRARAAGYDRVIVVNTDTPQLSAEDIASAFALLNEFQVVIGPAVDGGYYLLGIRDAWDLVLGIDMSTDTVLIEVLREAESRGLAVCEIEPLNDIDTLSDLTEFARRADASHGGCGLRTLAAANDLPLHGDRASDPICPHV